MAANVVEITEAFTKNRPLGRLRVKLFAAGADLLGIQALVHNPLIRGIITDLALLREAGVQDYPAFAKRALSIAAEKPVCLQVCTADFREITRQAKIIDSWGKNVYVTVPLTNSNGDGTYGIIQQLSGRGVKVNVTAIVKAEQVRRVSRCLSPNTPAILSIFAGTIADTGIHPAFTMKAARSAIRELPHVELLWAGAREVWNLFEAEAAGCDIVAAPHAVLHRALRSVGADLDAVAIEAARRMAYDSQQAAYSLSFPNA